MIKAVLFDFDHTLYDRDASLAACAEPFMTIAADYLRNGITRKEMAAYLCRADREGVYCGAWKKSAALLAEYDIYKGEPLPYEIYTEQFSRGAFPKNIRLFDDTVPTLETLKAQGFRIGMLTNGYVKYQWDKLNTVPEIHPYFEIIRVGEELPHPKPHPRAFLAMSGAMGLMPHEIAFVGDNPVSDICGARSVGMLPVWMRYLKEWPQEITPPPYAIDRLSELPVLLARINGKD
ncbi:MAG: HAD family hydrolase [Clostridia bacterium]|nr:HAD family hydrolase [Clostridia bacterium]